MLVKDLVEKRTGEECKEFCNGDHTTTLLRTANGKVIEIQHNVMTPQPYNRLYQLTGSKGFANKYPVEGYALDAAQLTAVGRATQSRRFELSRILTPGRNGSAY